MNEQNVLAALAQGRQQMVPVDAGACGAGGCGVGGMMAGYPYGGAGGACAQPWAPGVSPTFNGFVQPGVYRSAKVLGAEGIIGADGRVFRCVPGASNYIGADATLSVDINGNVVDFPWPGGFIPTIEEVGQGGIVRFTLTGQGYASICGWTWTETDDIIIRSAKAQGGFVNTVEDVAADAFNTDGCECPIAFACMTDKDAIELVLGVGCHTQTLQADALLTLILNQPLAQGAVAFLIDARIFAFAMYTVVYEALGACGTVAPLYNLAPNATPMFPAPPQGPCGPAAMQSGAYPAGGYPNGNGYMQPGMG